MRGLHAQQHYSEWGAELNTPHDSRDYSKTKSWVDHSDNFIKDYIEKPLQDGDKHVALCLGFMKTRKGGGEGMR